jgi:cytosine/adenosine deaminase-related metal-dependent hydrolase
MSATIADAILLPTDGASAGPPVDLVIENGVVAAIAPAASAPERRRLALPALVNAHDHCRPLSPTSFGAAGKSLETWLLRLAAMPPIDPYLEALSAFGWAAGGGAGSAHYTRFHGRCPRSRRRAASGRGCATPTMGGWRRGAGKRSEAPPHPSPYWPSKPSSSAVPPETCGRFMTD